MTTPSKLFTDFLQETEAKISIRQMEKKKERKKERERKDEPKNIEQLGNNCVIY